jgi:quinoprotein glucose dehydrogenase
MRFQIQRIAGCMAMWLVSTPFFIQPVLSADVAAEKPVEKPAVSAQAILAAKAFKVPEGFTLTTVASEPNLANGVAFCFDPTGRIFIAETYRVKKGVEDNREHMDWLDDDLACDTVLDRREYLKRRMGDRIGEYTKESEQVRLVEDRDGDGFYDSSSIFSTGYKNIEDGAAAGVLWNKDRLLFSCIPSLYELRDADGDGKAEEKRTLATGFGVHFALYGHDLHGLCKGPDGKIYVSIGDRGLNVDTPEGKLYNPGSGAVLRFNPDGSQLEFFATGLRNPQELAFNEFGDLITVDNNSDSGDKARLVHIVEGMNAGWRMAFQYLDDRGPFNREKIWHTQNAEQPASIIPPLAHIANGPSGLVHYPGTGMPAAYNGAFFLVDFRGGPANSGVREFHIEPSGATYKLADYKPFVSGVLSTDCDFAPSGDLYVLDWVEGWDGPGVGRIHRVSSDDAESKRQRTEMQAAMRAIGSASVEKLVGYLSHANMRVRSAAQERLAEAGGSAVEPLKKLAVSKNAALLGRIHAVWTLGEIAMRDPQLFAAIAERCGDDEPEVRAQAARALGWAARSDVTQRNVCGVALTKLLADSSPRVRSLAGISLGRLKYAGALPDLLQAAAKDGEDPTLRHSIAMAMAGGETSEKLVEAAKSADDLQRLVLVVAIGKQKSPLVAEFLNDKSERVVLEAARIIWDTPVPAAQPALAALLGKTSSSSDPLLRRVVAANVAERTPEHLQAVIDFACRANLKPALRDLAWDQVLSWASPSSRDSVIGEWRPMESRPAEEVVAVVQSSLPKIVEISGATPAGLIVAAELGVEGAYAPLLDIVTNNKLPDNTRVRAVAAFSKANDAVTHQAIDAALKARKGKVRSAARTLLSKRFPDQVVDELSETIKGGTMPERQAAMDALAGLAAPAAHKLIGEWMGQLESGKCPPELQLEVLEAASNSMDAALAARQKNYTDKLASAGPVARYANCLTGGDAQRGQKIFETNDTLACRRCHSVKPGEVLVGPCLASIGLQRKPEEILESILAPNAKICEGFETAVLELDSGKVVTGIVRYEDKSKIELVDAEAKQIVIDPATVENRIKGKSPMPENLMERMKPRELRDVIAYLSQLKAPISTPQKTAAAGK